MSSFPTGKRSRKTMRKYHVQVLMMNGRWQNTYFTNAWPKLQSTKWRGTYAQAFYAMRLAMLEFPNELYRIASVKG